MTGRGPFPATIGAILCLTGAFPARADDKPAPTISLSVRDSLDLWDVAEGGRRTGAVALNKLQLSGTLQGDTFGLKGLSVHAQVFRTDGSSLSRRVGDVQTVDSIDAVPVTRLFEAWIEQKVGGDDRSVALRAGLIDLNADFDSTQTASLFVNSSQGIGADLARSGTNGPSIYPVSALGARLSLIASKRWTIRLAAFDGVPGDPARPKAFVAARLARADGALLIGQLDYHITDDARIEAGMWHYTQTVPALAAPFGHPVHDEGAYASIDGPIPGAKHWSAWARVGIASAEAQQVDGYFGAGLVRTGLFEGRKDDRIGIAVARASIGEPAQRSLGLPSAETSIEASYQFRISTSFAAQPDIQYIVHPASESGIRDAFVLGLRMVFTAGFPKRAPATEATDPTVPPDGPQPPDASGGADEPKS